MGSDYFTAITGIKLALSLMTSLLPFILPFILIALIWKMYVKWRRLKFVSNVDSILLEVVFPLEMERPIAAMELVLNVLGQTGFGTIAEVYIDGAIRPWFSLEIASNGGQVRFYIWTWKKFKNMIEQAFYAQYPNIEIRQAPDYMKGVEHDPSARYVWGTDYKLSKSDAYPLKTYIDYELNKNPDEIYKVDPLTPIIEQLGSIGTREKMWFQILVRAHDPSGWKHADLSTWSFRKEETDPKTKIKKKIWSPGSNVAGLSWSDRINVEIQQIIDKRTRKMLDAEGKEIPSSMVNFEPGEEDLIKTLRRHQGKTPFEILVRSVYIAESDVFDAGNISALINYLRGFAGSNKLGLNKKTDVSDDVKDLGRIFPMFQSLIKKEVWEKQEALLNAMKSRSRFYPPFDDDDSFTAPYVVSVEALATLFHPVGSVSGTPSLERVDAKRSQPPSNLPF